MFLLPTAMAVGREAIARGWSASLTVRAGQFCTNPGIAVVREGEAEAQAEVGSQVMLTEGIATAYADGARRMAGALGVRGLSRQVCDRRQVHPQL